MSFKKLLITVLSDDSGINSRLASLIPFTKLGCILVRSKYSPESISMYDNMFQIEMDLITRQMLLTIFKLASSDLEFSEILVKAANFVSKSLANKEKLNLSHIELLISKVKDYTSISSEFTNYSLEKCREEFERLKTTWAESKDQFIPEIPIFDESIRIAGCAGTKKLCDILDRLIEQLENHNLETKPIKSIFIGRHGLSTKTYGKEWNGRSDLFKKGKTTSVPDFGHNVKIYGERGHESRYFSLLKKLKLFSKSRGIRFEHFTTNSFYTKEDGSGVPGSRLTCLRKTNEGTFLDFYGNETNALARGEKPLSIPIHLDAKLNDILDTLCFTKKATFMHDLKLCWILSNYEKLSHFFEVKVCELWSGVTPNGENDMLFHPFSEHDIEGYKKAITQNMVLGIDKTLPNMDKIEELLIKIGKSKTIIQERFVTEYSNSWKLTKLFHENFSNGIYGLKISAMVTDPGPGHIKKAHDGYFPLGPQDGDDMMALYGIIHPDGAIGIINYD